MNSYDMFKHTRLLNLRFNGNGVYLSLVVAILRLIRFLGVKLVEFVNNNLKTVDLVLTQDSSLI